ncbi:putative glycosyltransferase [Candidatus Methylobacter favarea]|uniref:Putative glycosyltransferase n=1 Tax=Candidatus Methylobacter favarea TaxID=2707345 RepID=A0A8S0XJ32_9GAMM|nr:glycosyltransferase [Candidatus Methylobacter favarea]CAA9891196.1 putative glycosyltransferase [Candidatus Methylobacter favarea]
MNQNSLITAASFTPESLQSPNAWVGHLPFAAWVIQEIAPTIFVELGTHSGNSYFSFCQSVVEAGLSTKCYAVDTWQGDEHAGQYDEQIFGKVNAYHQERYAGFSRLLRMTFDDAVSYFADESIELLHIDGLHTYEAVRHDFDTWLSKLAPGAVVMFHDTNVRERNFGVWKLWQELQASYPNNLEFVHSHGLGVLQLNNAPDDKKLEWLQPGSPEKQRLIKYFAALGSRQLERFELNELKQHAANLNQVVADRQAQIASLNQAVAWLDSQIANFNQTVAERDSQIASLDQGMAECQAQIANLKQTMTERDGQIASLNQTVTERDSQISSLHQAVAERDSQITRLNQTGADRDSQITSLDQAVAEYKAQMPSFHQAVAERDNRIVCLNQTVTECQEQITTLSQAVQDKDGQMATLNQALAERGLRSTDRLAAMVSKLTQEMAERDRQITSLNQAVQNKDGQIANLNQALADRELRSTDRLAALVSKLTQEIAERDRQIASINQAVTEREGQIARLNQTVAERDEEIDSLNQTTVSYAGALKTIEEIRASSSWQITLPIRYTSSKTRNIVSLVNLLPRIIRFGGGVKESAAKAGRVFSREGWSGVKRRILFVGGNRGAPTSSTIRPDLTSAEVDRNDYSEWVRRYDTLTDIDRNKIKSKIAGFTAQPLISVIMPVYNPPISFLEEAIRSVRNQLYSNWELCIADDASTDPTVRKLLEQHRKQDGRIKVVYRKQNGHISRSSNSALELAQGEFVALFDHDDLLAEHALYRAVKAINRHPDVGLIYSDEDKIDESNLRYDPYFKCALNYELLLAQNMISHLGIYRTDIVRSLGGFRVGYEGSQDYDLALRVIERLGPNQIIHIPHVLYHWRAIAGSTALAVSEKNYAVDASRKAVAEHLQRRGISAEVMPAPEAPMFNRVRFICPSPQPLVSIIIPTRDRADLLGMCVDSLIQRTTYSNYEVIIMDNGSVEDATRQFFDRLPNDRFRVLRDESPFNFSALNNHAARAARGELLCLMNNDIEILTPDWLEEMVSFAIHSDIGCVGARLWYPDGALQHGGVLLGIGGVANHAHYKIGRGNPGYFGRAVLHQSLSAVTAACLLVRRQVFEEVGGLDEQLAVAFNDIDFCLRVREAGYRNVWTPYAEMNHHESASRKNEDTPEKLIRFRNEVGFMQDGWGEILLDDPAYSPNLTLDDEHFSYAWPPRVSL